MSTNRVEGAIDKGAGAVKEAVGKVQDKIGDAIKH